MAYRSSPLLLASRGRGQGERVDEERGAKPLYLSRFYYAAARNSLGV
jgi:hypothetical protein